MNIFSKHPNSVGETYFQHLGFAFAFGANMIIGGFACMIHAIFPFWFEQTGSDYLLKLTKNFIERMPTLDDRVIELGNLIEKKKTNKT